MIDTCATIRDLYTHKEIFGFNRNMTIDYIAGHYIERKIMSNIKITAEVDGKQVPLETVSTETFEAIKALEKQKEIPVARLATCSHSPRLLFKPTFDIVFKVGTIYALDLRRGFMACSWTPNQDENIVASQYKEVVVI